MLTVIERDVIKKPKLGGWRNTITGVEYLNADSQTGPPPKRIPLEQTCSREVQTIITTDQNNQSTYEQATQMWRRDCYIPSISDKYLTVKPYMTYDELQSEKKLLLDVHSKACIIQKCYRAYRILKFIKACARLYRKLRMECEELSKEKFLEIRDRYLADCQALNKPRNLLDLDALIHHMEKSELGDQQLDPITLLKSRRRIFLVANEKLRREQELRSQSTKARFLARDCQPKRWLDRKNKSIEMLTLKNQIAREFMDMYNQLGETDENCRVKILLKARYAVEHHDCKDANTFRELLDQEIIMLSKDVEQTKFNYLKKRILGAFLQFVKTSHNCTCTSVKGTESISLYDYEFREPLEKKYIFCISCRRLLPCSKFLITNKKKQIKKCKGCIRLLRNVRSHVDLRPYEKLLSEVREAEGPGSLAGVLSVLDVYHLVFRIWHGHSILSEVSDMRELSLPRYDSEAPWSPWNCILLTREEADAHRCIRSGKSIYSIHLRRKVRSAHRTANIDFRVHLLNMVFVVEIEDRTSPKPFLGGWRDTKCNIEYHDAASQTSFIYRTQPQREMVSVSVQMTGPARCSRSIGTGGIERAVQANGICFPELGESFIIARSSMELQRRQEAAIKIQRFYRAHRSLQFTHDKDNNICSLKKFGDISVTGSNGDFEEDRSISVSTLQSYNCSTSILDNGFQLLQLPNVHVRNPKDLAPLQHLLDCWGVAEEARIQRKIEILRAIESSRSKISQKKDVRAMGKFLKDLSKPIDLEVSCAPEEREKKRVKIKTLNVQRARELRDVYEGLMIDEDSGNEASGGGHERIEHLLRMKKIVSQHTCRASSSLENLIDQELFLLSSRVDSSRLKHLRSRVRLGFLALARDSLRHDNRMKPRHSMWMRLCSACCKLRSFEDFEVDHRGRLSRTCIDCTALRTRGNDSKVYSNIYEKMLEELRSSEASRVDDGSGSLAFAVGIDVIHYLMTSVWHGRSVISECNDLGRLCLARLEPVMPWSPWNTLLVTKREARIHETLMSGSTLDAVYHVELLRKLRRMNLQAWLYFESLAKIGKLGLLSRDFAGPSN
ncbi:PREDICTED: uncharacterized protein LOC105359475 [Ceratosolen solmsi marchali]|uniref:Uncharacterized protein LOC105359475 n=1 Tax=Ceratosolen solmsi marchali TaxID=326594 RepID=A0AAJ6VKZ9_9HYME|nr:PREDICTED: uncharacterized protein LOC105359475 [Ceratosolen solmsi marchali]